MALFSLHATETTLLRVQNDTDWTLDMKCTTILTMLDLLFPFDSIVHELTMTPLERSFGITDKAFPWSKSYITEQHEKVPNRLCCL